MECGEGCKRNRQMTEHEWDDFEVFNMGGEMGWGLKAMRDYEEGTVICKYTGRVKSEQQHADQLEKKTLGDPMYSMQFKGHNGWYMDGEQEGGPGRFANHNCGAPTARFETWWTMGTQRLALVANRGL